jgi:hypothetical protein
MRKLIVGLTMVVGLLAVMPPAMAQSLVVPGSSDPVGLITSGAVLPFLGEGTVAGGTGLSFLELLAPVDATTVHMFLFDANCVRNGPSVNVELTPNDVALFRIDTIGPPIGLVTAAQADTGGFTLLPWIPQSGQAIAARTLWANSNGNFVRVIDPIALATLDDVVPTGTGGWHPMRTAAAFFAPFEGGGLHTTMYFVCPNANIQRHVPSNGGALSPSNGFPIIFPSLQAVGATTPLRVRVYDDDEALLRDVTSTCSCLTTRKVTDLDPVYASAVEAPDGTYTEVEGAGSVVTEPAVCDQLNFDQLVVPNTPNAGNSCPGAPLGCSFAAGTCVGQFHQITPAVTTNVPFSFVAYRAITVPGFDVFNRVAGGSICQIRGAVDPVTGAIDSCTTSNVINTGGR